MVSCPYCGLPADLVTGVEVYPHRPDLYDKQFWVCDSCDARVGCHGDTEEPLGRLANAELRQARVRVHAVFDELWKNGPKGSRSTAYTWLSRELCLTVKKCHIGNFDLQQCRTALEACAKLRAEMEEDAEKESCT